MKSPWPMAAIEIKKKIHKKIDTSLAHRCHKYFRQQNEFSNSLWPIVAIDHDALREHGYPVLHGFIQVLTPFHVLWLSREICRDGGEMEKV